jgi:hypothetical protein
VTPLLDEIAPLWGPATEPRRVSWSLAVRVGRVGAEGQRRRGKTQLPKQRQPPR